MSFITVAYKDNLPPKNNGLNVIMQCYSDRNMGMVIDYLDQLDPNNKFTCITYNRADSA